MLGWRQTLPLFPSGKVTSTSGWFREGHHPENLHDQHCEIFNCRGLSKKKEALLHLVNVDPRWIFDPCGIEIFFRAASERNYRFFKELSQALGTVKLEQHHNDLDHLRWFVYSKTPLWTAVVLDEEKRGEYLASELHKSYSEISKIIRSKPSLVALGNVPCLKSAKSFHDTCIKWYKKDLHKIGHRVPPAKKGRPKRSIANDSEKRV